MTRSGWIPALIGIALLLVTVVIPALALVAVAASQESSGVAIRSAGELLTRSLAWSVAVAMGALAIGWAPGLVLGRSLAGRRGVLWAILIVLPLCLPAYVVFYAWYQSWPADSALFRWAASTDRIQLLRELTLFAGLVCWSWPIVSLCIAASSRHEPAAEQEQFRLDGAAWPDRARAGIRRHGAAALTGGLLVALLTMNNTTCFDLSQVFTFGNELRAIEAMGANVRDSLVVSAPVVVIGLLGAVGLWSLFRPGDTRVPDRAPAVGGAQAGIACLVVLLCFVLPLVLFLGRLLVQANAWNELKRFLELYNRGVLLTAGVGVGAGLAGGALALSLSFMWMDRRRLVRGLGHFAAVCLVLAALVPGILVGVALEAAYNRVGPVGDLYRSPIILAIGHLARFGIVAALLARWLNATEPNDLRDARRIDGAVTFAGLFAAGRARIVPAALASFALIAVFSMSEIPVTSFVNPPARPGAGPIAVKILNDMHYQRPQTVMIATLAMVALAFVGASVLATLWRTAGRSARAACVGMIACTFVVLTGCGEHEDGQPLPTQLTFGSPGLSLGQFSYPRACAADPERNWLFVVDKTARVQRFGFDGEPQVEWRMPDWENGKPTGMNVGPEGNVFVADTHYFRVIEYDADGNEIMRFGEYGTGPGQFIFPTDVEFGADGRLYVSEYGGNDRIQVFSAEGEFLFAFGEIGEQPHQFNRPQSMEFSADRSELYIADSCNHRIVVRSPDGEVLRMFGTPGDEPGELSYPYDLMLLDDGTLLVCEFGNNRLQHFSTDGESLGTYGRVGTREGELLYPWALDGGSEAVFVVDSGNNRVHRIRPP